MPTFEESTNPLPDAGEVMLLTFHQDRHRWRPVIYVGPPEEPNNASQLYLGEWRNSLRKAQVTGLKVYFDCYLERYGFRHPEDPARCGDRTPLPYNVVSLRGEDGEAQSYTCDEWPEDRQSGVH